MSLEQRSLEVFGISEPLQIRDAEGDQPAKLVGYAAVFNSLSADLGGFREQIAPGAFSASLGAGGDIRALVDHDASKLLGRTNNGTLKLSEDQRGLQVTVDLPDTSYARDLREMIRRGDINGMSFGFNVPKGGDSFSRQDGQTIRTLNAITLREVTVTSIPAYGATNVSLRIDPTLSSRIAEANVTGPGWERWLAYRKNIAA